ncbi:MAG: GNAT family protein [Rickettsiales bacterium]
MLLETFKIFPKIKFEIIDKKTNIPSYYLLREINVELDSQHYYNYMQNIFVSKYLADGILVNSIEKAKKDMTYWRGVFYDNSSLYWAITEITALDYEKDPDQINANNIIIGTVGFNYIDIKNNLSCISYDLDYNHWGRGIMRCAINLLCNLIKEKLNITKTEATVVKNNINSINALEKNGFYLMKIIKNHEIINSKWVDSYVYIRNN